MKKEVQILESKMYETTTDLLPGYEYTITIIPDKIDIEVEFIREVDMSEQGNNFCSLWSSDDEGELYTKKIDLSDTSLVTVDEKITKVLFKKVIPKHRYSCHIELGSNYQDKAGHKISVFNNIYITQKMAVSNQNNTINE